jgi:hypothetical protein
MRRSLFILLATLLCIPRMAIAQDVHREAAAPVIAATEPKLSRGTACTLGGWTNNKLTAPIAVRAAPDRRAAVIGTIPLFPKLGPGEDAYSATMQIVGSANGYLKIANASDAMNTNPRPIFSGSGWVDGNAVRFVIQSSRGYARPDERSERIVDLDYPDNSRWATEVGEIDRVIACQGEWVQIDLLLNRDRNDPMTILPRAKWKRQRAWFRGVCAIEETSCDMESVDK